MTAPALSAASTDETFGDEGRPITLGGTSIELLYLGLNHSDTNVVMRLPKERIIFVVDTIPVGQVPARGMIDFYPLESEEFIGKVIALDWERLIPGHPGPGDRLGTKQDARDQLAFLQDASAEMKKLAREGKCWDQGEKEFKLSKIRELARLCGGPALHRAALLRARAARAE